jgi:hypothetical protein
MYSKINKDIHDKGYPSPQPFGSELSKTMLTRRIKRGENTWWTSDEQNWMAYM